MSWQGFLKSKWATWLLALVLIFIGLFAARVLIQKHQIDSEISKLQEQADKINKDNEQLSALIKYMNTPEYEEKAAREKLNLKKEGEYVVVLPNSDENSAGTNASANTSNIKQWFNYFFRNQ